MYQKPRKNALWKSIAIFFSLMLLLTLLSRWVYQSGTAVVTTAAPSGGVIAHTVELTGKITENQELAVTTEAGLRIASVCVHEGQQVSPGDPLFTLDLSCLAEEIQTQQQEMEKLKLTIQDGYSQNSAAQQRRANAQAQAEENYDWAVSQAETALERAARNLERAKQALEDFYHGADQSREEEEQALLTACQEAEALCAAAQEALSSLTSGLEAAIADAIAQAQAGREEPLTPEETNAITQALTQEYSPGIADAQAALESAQARKAQADESLEAFRSAPTQPPDPASEEALLAQVEQAQQSYDDALSSLDTAETTYSRAIQSASLPEATSHSPQITQITYDQMALKLEKLLALQKSGGAITAPVEGVVTSCAVQTGGRTGDTAALLLADLSQGCRFSGLVTQEQSEYIGVGDSVILTALATNKEYTGLTVTTLSSRSEGEEGYRLTVQVPGSSLTLGASVRLKSVRKSPAYTCCVPLSALHVDAQNRPYVLVAEEAETVLGTQTQARAVSVTVLEKNGSLAALEPGALHAGQQIIVTADRPIDSGSRIRVQ